MATQTFGPFAHTQSGFNTYVIISDNATLGQINYTVELRRTTAAQIWQYYNLITGGQSSGGPYMNFVIAGQARTLNYTYDFKHSQGLTVTRVRNARTATADTQANKNGLRVGMVVASGTSGIPNGTSITGLGSGLSFTLSANMTLSGTVATTFSRAIQPNTVTVGSGTVTVGAGVTFSISGTNFTNNSGLGNATVSGSFTSAPAPQPFFPPSFPFFPTFVPAAVWTTTSFTETVLVNSPYTKTVTATGIRSTNPYELVGGTTVLPGGLTLNRSTGVISGTPTAGVSQTFNFTVNAFNSAGSAVASETFTLNRRQPLPVWSDDILGTPRVGTAYSDQVAATNAASTNAYSAVGLPANGLSLNPDTGAVTGTPTSTSPFSFIITAKNSDNQTIQKNFTLTARALLAIWNDQIITAPTVRVNQPYLDGVDAANAVSYALETPNTLPPGIALNTSTGAITGTPTTEGTYNFRVIASNASSPAETISTNLLSILVEPSAGGFVWDGNSWVPSVFKVWNGAIWEEAPVKIWNGSIWADPNS